MATPRKTIPQIRLARFRLSLVICKAFISIMLACCGFSLAQTLTVLHQFNGGPGDGYNPYAPVVIGQNGMLYGTTVFGGNSQDCNGIGCGEVYQVGPPAQPGGAWNYSAIYEFTGGNDGCCVYSALTLGSQGQLYGANNSLFELSNPTSAFWQYYDLYDFPNGVYPNTPLLIDSTGALYGVNAYTGLQQCGGGANFYFCGVVSQFVPTQNGPWTENILYQFTGGADGAFPASIALDSATGTLYGIASLGGIIAPNCTEGCGTVFKLAPTPGGTWKYTVLYSFTGVHDLNPYALVRDSSGNLYGLASRGQYGTEIFELTPRKKGAWTEKVLHGFSGHDIPTEYCGYPPSYLTLGANGVLYGAIFGDIDLYFGALFQLTPPASGKGPWAYATIWDFNESGPDLNPNGVVLGADGALYGTTNGGDSDGGTVFQLQLPSQAPWPPSDFCY